MLVLLISLHGSSPGEVAGAMGAVLGGMIGALGSAAAVYILLGRERDDEIQKVSAAVLAEVVALAKFPLGQLEMCEQLKYGQVKVPKAGLPMAMHVPEPVIYPAVADRVSRLPSAMLVVAFFSGLAELRGLVSLIANSKPEDPIVEIPQVDSLAEMLVHLCILAAQILDRQGAVSAAESQTASKVRQVIRNRLDHQINRAKLVWPNAEWYQEETPAGAEA